ncbi:MAG: DUF2828 family protein [Actinobacteria bacterium]|nr:DUF2828 family protein [Actinomycetota bacterium]
MAVVQPTSNWFINAMNSHPLTKLGVKGSNVYTETGVGDLRLSLFQMLVRGLQASEIRRVINTAFTSPDKAYLLDFIVMAFQTRDIRGGKGERDVAFHMFMSIMLERPNLIEPLLRLIPEYGCWKDMWKLWAMAENYTTNIQDSIINVVKWFYFEDLSKLDKSAGNTPKLSLLGKWLPREGSKYDKIANKLADVFYPDVSLADDRLRLYRKECSRLSKALGVIEQKMCGEKWREIRPEAVPGRLMMKARKAFLNEIRVQKKWRDRLDGDEEPSLRFPNSLDRMECRTNFLWHMEQVLAGKAAVNAANVLYPHEIVAKFWNACGNQFPKSEENLLQAQWNAIRDVAKTQGGLRGIVPMSDFSGSMHGIPMMVSMALGVLLSEINHPAFADYLLGFDSDPSWISFKGMTSLQQKIKYAQRFARGTSTNFQGACDLILRRLVEYKVPPEEAPRDLLVLTDMGFDAANRTGVNWETHLQSIRSRFSAAGYEAPRIIIWNLRAEYKDYHARADEEGVVVLSGWSPAVLKAIQKGGVTVRTPYQGLRELLDDTRYDLVRETFRNAL